MKGESIAVLVATAIIVLTIFYIYGATINDIITGGVLALWVIIVIFFLSKPVARIWNKYIARKFIHFLTGGLVTILIYLTWLLGKPIFSSPAVPVSAAFILAAIVLIPHIEQAEMDWFQVKNNLGEVWFCITWGAVFLAYWYIDITIPVLATYFMAFGDGVTGIVRNFIYRRWTKGLWGSIAMFLVSVPAGVVIRGLEGLVAALVATVIEKIPTIDDNLTVPIGSALLLTVMQSLSF